MTRVCADTVGFEEPKTREWLAPWSVERRTSVATLGGTKDDKTASGRRRRSYGRKPATAGGDRIVGQGDEGSTYATFSNAVLASFASTLPTGNTQPTVRGQR